MIFHHIPSTNGRNFCINTTHLIEVELLKLGRQYGDILKARGHRPVSPVYEGETNYIIFRDPILRTISHWCHLLGERPKTKEAIFKFLVENPDDYLVNYQTKFVCYDKEIIRVGDDYVGFEADIDLAKERLSKVSYVFDMENLNYGKFRDILYDHFAIAPTFEWNDYFHIGKNPMVPDIYKELTAAEKSELEQLFKHDMELYYTTKYSEI
jgi:hypothetical protein